MKTLNLKLVPNLPKREAKYIRVLRYFNKPMTLGEMEQGQYIAFKGNSEIIKKILTKQGFKQHNDWDGTDLIELTPKQQQDNGDYSRAYYALLIYYPEPSYGGGTFTQKPSNHFSGLISPPQKLPVTRKKINGKFIYSLKS